MERFHDVLLDVWREVGRHLEIRESAPTIAAMLAKHLPLACLLVRRLDGQHQALDTVALGQPVSQPLDVAARTSLTAAKYKRLLAWSQESELLHGQRLKRSGDLAVLVPSEIEGEVLAGSLLGPEGPAGALVLSLIHI